MLELLSRRGFFKRAINSGVVIVSLASGFSLNSRVLGFHSRNILERNIELDESYLEALENCNKCLNNRETRCPYWQDGVVGKCSYFELLELKDYKKTYPD